MPVAPVTWTRSEPARSTRFSLPTLTGWDGLSPPGKGGRMLPAGALSLRQPGGCAVAICLGCKALYLRGGSVLKFSLQHAHRSLGGCYSATRHLLRDEGGASDLWHAASRAHQSSTHRLGSSACR